jgi:hypothetical protein
MGRLAVRMGLVLGVAMVVSAGCTGSSTTTRTVQTMYEGNLDECREMRLSYDLVEEREGWNLPRKYEQLTLEISPREDLHALHALEKVAVVEGEMPPGKTRYVNVDARTDRARERVWFVQHGTRRIIATYDRLTGKVTGPDDTPPVWAKPDGGVPLDLHGR